MLVPVYKAGHRWHMIVQAIEENFLKNEIVHILALPMVNL